MPNIANVLKAEITRLARKELREETAALRKTVASQRADIVSLKRRLAALESEIKRAAKVRGSTRTASNKNTTNSEEVDSERGAKRFSAKGLATNRKRLGLSAADFGKLVGVTGQSIYAWEAGKSQPRAPMAAMIAALRGVGKREVAARLEALRA